MIRVIAGLSGGLRDTWVYDGIDWEQLFPLVSPSARLWAAHAYDAQRKELVLFGGCCPQDSETWEFSYRGAAAEEQCRNGRDDDGDELVDCDDPDCNADPACWPVEQCRNGVDDDGDGLVDCNDPNCGGALCDANGSRCIALTCQPQ